MTPSGCNLLLPDRFYQFSERHGVFIETPSPVVLSAIKQFDVDDDRAIRMLMAAREGLTRLLPTVARRQSSQMTRYWWAIRAPSGFVRERMLAAVKRRAEKAPNVRS